MPAPLGSRRLTRRVLGSVLLLIVLVTAANLVARRVIERRLRHGAAQRLSGPIGVRLAGAPALVDAVNGSIQGVTLTAPRTSVCRLSGVRVRASLAGVHTVATGAVVHHIGLRVLLPAPVLTRRARQIGLGMVTVATDPTGNLLRLSAGPGGALQVEEAPTLDGSQLVLRPRAIMLLGQRAPQQLARSITERATLTRNLHAPLGLRATDVRVVGGGLEIDLASRGQTLIRTHRQAAKRRC